MTPHKFALLFLCLPLFALSPSASHAASCNSNQDAAVDCFVTNAVRTGLTSPRYGMTMSQFRAYGVSVSKILQTDETYLVIVGVSSAIADAMPPTNSDGTANVSAQQTAIAQITSALLANGLAALPSETTRNDLQYFAMDIVNAMDTSGGYLQLMTPGISLRVIDSYVVTGTSNGSVNWSAVDANLANALSNMVASGLIKIPSAISQSQLNSFVDSVAQAIWTYKRSTNRGHL